MVRPRRAPLLRVRGPHDRRRARLPSSSSPQGPHAEEERRLVASWEKEQIEGPAREKKALEDARKKADAARKALGETIEAWTQKAVKLSAYRVDRATLEKNDGQFAEPVLPRPARGPVRPEGCSKRYTFGYAVPEANPPLDRKVGLEVRMETAAGLVVAISMVLPRYGFVYWLEGAEVRAVEKTDPAVQAEALMRADRRREHRAQARRRGLHDRGGRRGPHAHVWQGPRGGQEGPRRRRPRPILAL